MYRNQASNHICQVNIAETYDHKHQPLSEDDRSERPFAHVVGYFKGLIRKLATRAIVLVMKPFGRSRQLIFIALDMVRIYQTDAEINGLSFDIDAEERAVELFAENIMRAGEEFYYSPMETPAHPSWTRVLSAIPDIGYQLRKAVEADNQDLR